MGSAENIRRNTLFSFLSTATRLVANVLMFVGIARYYGPVAFGQFTSAHTTMTLLLALSDFGFDFFLATEVARSPQRAGDVVRRLFPFKLLFTLISILCLLSLAWMSSLSAGTQLYMAILAVSIAGNAVSTFLFALFKGHEQLHHETRISFIQNAFLLIVLVALGLLHVPLAFVALAFVASRLLGATLAVAAAIRVLHIRLLPLVWAGTSPLFKRVVPFGIHLLFGTLYFQLDTILLAYWKGDQAVGTYQAVMKLVVLVLVVPDVAVAALLPALSRMHLQDREKWIRLGRLSARTLLFICLPVTLMFLIYPGQVISLVYGQGFAEAVPVLRMFALVLLARFGAADILALMISTADRQSIRMWVMIAATLLNISCNAYAIPRYGVMGAATVSLLTNLFVATCYIVGARWCQFTLSFWGDRKGWLPVLVTVVLGALLWELGAWTFVPGIVVAVILCPLVYLFWGYTPAERKLVLAIPASA